MGQYWLLLNIDKRQKGEGVGGKFAEFLFRRHDWLVKLLARPCFPDVLLPAYYLSTPTRDESKQGPIAAVPPEVFAAIFSFIPSVDDAVCLASTHCLLASEGFRRVVELRRDECVHWGSWAGDRIITAGDYLDDLPTGMLTPVEADEIEDEPGLYDFASENYKKNPPLSLVVRKGKKDVVKTAFQRVSPDTSRGDYLRVRLLLESTAPRYAPHVSWALCNMSRKKYIRASDLARMKILGEDVQFRCSVEGPFVKGPKTVIGLGTLAIIMTADSSDMGDVGTYGPWAGDRLAIAMVEELPGEGWEDDSARGLKTVKQCVMANDDMF